MPHNEVVPEKPKKTRKRKEKVEIDELTRDTRAILKGDKSNKSILRGMIERIDIIDNAPSPETSVCAIVRYNNFKVIIPAISMALRDVPQNISGQEKISKYKH